MSNKEYIIIAWFHIEGLAFGLNNDSVPTWISGRGDGQVFVFPDEKTAWTVAKKAKAFNITHDKPRELTELQVILNDVEGYGYSTKTPTQADYDAIGIKTELRILDVVEDREEEFKKVYAALLDIWYAPRPPYWIEEIFNENSTFLTGVLATNLVLHASSDTAYTKFYKASERKSKDEDYPISHPDEADALIAKLAKCISSPQT